MDEGGSFCAEKYHVHTVVPVCKTETTVLLSAWNKYFRVDYLAIVMDLYSRRIVGGSIDKRMTTNLVKKALIKAVNLRQPNKGLVFHSDLGSQYTSKSHRHLLENHGLRSSMGDVGACWDNAVVERFFWQLEA